MIRCLVKNIIDVIYPDYLYCICCGKIIDKNFKYRICNFCMKEMKWAIGKTCDRCGKPLDETYDDKFCEDCQTYEHIFDKGYTCTEYGNFEKKMLLDFKYGGHIHKGVYLGRIMAERLRTVNFGADIIIPIPIHISRTKSRGFNQAAILAKEISEALNIEMLNYGIYRRLNTKAMRGLSPIAREVNIKDAFRISDIVKPYIRGKDILIVDDIYTTGATIDEMSQILRECSVGKISFITFSAGRDHKI